MTLEGRTVAVTGAGGFIGRAVCARLRAAGALVRGARPRRVLPPSGSAGAGATFAPCDITDAAARRRGARRTLSSWSTPPRA